MTVTLFDMLTYDIAWLLADMALLSWFTVYQLDSEIYDVAGAQMLAYYINRLYIWHCSFKSATYSYLQKHKQPFGNFDTNILYK